MSSKIVKILKYLCCHSKSCHFVTKYVLFCLKQFVGTCWLNDVSQVPSFHRKREKHCIRWSKAMYWQLMAAATKSSLKWEGLATWVFTSPECLVKTNSNFGPWVSHHNNIHYLCRSLFLYLVLGSIPFLLSFLTDSLKCFGCSGPASFNFSFISHAEIQTMYNILNGLQSHKGKIPQGDNPTRGKSHKGKIPCNSHTIHIINNYN